MKRIFRFATLLFASAVPFVSCEVDNPVKSPLAKDGDEIVFGARAGFENSDPSTKTVYSGEFYTIGSAKFERIDWLDKSAGASLYDKIEIYSPEADNGPTAHYDVNDSQPATEQNDYAYLTASGSSSLQWNGEGVHHFYAMYPSSEVFAGLQNETTLKQGVKMDGTVLKGIVPAAQNPYSVVDDGNGNYTLEPDMRYAYMAARSTASISDETVSLSFVPIVTAVKVTMVASNVDVSIAELRVSGSGIVGDFSAELSESSWTGTYPVCTNSSTNNGDVVTVSTWQRNAQGNLVPLVLEAGKSLTFTVFLRPGADYTGLRFSFSSTGASYVGKSLKDTVIIPRNKKTVISNVALPGQQIVIDASGWMGQVEDPVLLKRLSIPGTGGSFSYGYNRSNVAYYKSQTLNFDQQWTLGIRAFELITDRPSNASTSIAYQYIKCNKTAMDETVQSVFQKVLAKLVANPREAAVLILTYQPEGNSPNRNPGSYVSSVMRYLNTLDPDRFIMFTPTLTMGQARGKIIVVLRPTQRDEDASTAFTNVTNNITGTMAEKVLAIDGCGTGKDKWGARGYNINGNRAYDISNKFTTNANVFEWHLQQGAFIHPNADTTPVSKGNTRFDYPTNTSGVVCWFQEWARVVGEDVLLPRTQGNYQTVNATYWFESYTEKFDNAKQAFTMAISDNHPNFVFINSLCGYLAGSDHKDSITPSIGNEYGGAGGNIQALADKINVDFYNFVLESGMEQATGPTGVVLMDYVSNSEADGGAYYLPGVIIANNFKYDYGNTSGTGGGDQGGNVDPGESEDAF